MDPKTIDELLEGVRSGKITLGAAREQLALWPLHDTGSALLDLQREARCGMPEAVFASGKTSAELLQIVRGALKKLPRVFCTRVTDDQAAALKKSFPKAQQNRRARTALLGKPLPPHKNDEYWTDVLIVCAGTSDLGVAEEALETLRVSEVSTRVIADVGVAGLHRLLAHLDELRRARIIICAAGMEGALPSVVGGLVACPVLAVPVSTGYGAGAGGHAALNAMLNSCAAGVSVFNIDNGFGAALAAVRILKGPKGMPF